MAISENSIIVLEYMKDHDGEDILSSEIAEELSLPPKTVTGVINAYVRKKMMFREEHEVEENGKTKVIKFIRLTDLGRDFDPTVPPTED